MQIYNEFLMAHNVKLPSCEDVRHKACNDLKRFKEKTVPALLEMAKEIGELPKQNASENG